MKKRLLFALMAMCVAVSGFALSNGEYVYTPQGRFMITSQNVASSNFADFTGWTVVSATEGKTIDQNFNINANGYKEGMNSVVSLDATVGEGMYFKFEPASADQIYVVSFKMKGTAQMSVRNKVTVWDGNNPANEVTVPNVVRVVGNSANTFGAADDEFVVNTGEELTADWQTFNYAIVVEDGIARTWFISFTGMPTTVEIADLQIAAATQVADLRQRDEMLEKLNAYKNCYDWDADVLDDNGITEGIEALEGITDASTQATLNEALETANAIINEFVKAMMDDYLANETNYLGIRTASGNLQKQSNLGDWTCVDRGFWSSGAYPDLGHYQYGNSWSNGNPDNAMGVTIQKQLSTGSYVFAIEANAALREPGVSKNWTNDEGMKPAYGVAYVVKIVEGTATDTVVSVVKNLDPVKFTPFYAIAKITDDGTYEFGFKAYCHDAYKSLKNGSVTYVANASIRGKNENVYNQAQLSYEADVREQITTARDAITKANGYLADEAYLWGKSVLKDSVDAAEIAIAPFEAMSQDEIIYTYDNAETDYEKDNRTKSAEQGLLVYEVYVKAVRGILDANKKFLAVNDTLNSMQAVIDAAEATLALRVYDAATGKDALNDAITKAKGIQAEMKAAQYSIENAATIVAANRELNDAIDLFKTTIPESAIATIVDIDFETPAVLNEQTSSYSIAGAAGAMEFSHFSEVNPEGEDSPFQQGFWDGGEQKWKGYLRVGNGTGTAVFDPTSGTADMGTNILRISCDFYIQGLSNRYIGFYMQNESDSTLVDLRRNYYNGTDQANTFNADMSKVWAKSGGAYNDASPADAENPTATVIEKTNFEVIMDYGTGTTYVNITSPNGSNTSEPVAFSGIPVKFVVDCNYDNKFATRRPWFDNLKIQRIAAGAYDGIADVNAAAKVVMPKKVIKNGRIVIDGKYGVNGIIIRK